jgi:hypothetical protein
VSHLYSIVACRRIVGAHLRDLFAHLIVVQHHCMRYVGRIGHSFLGETITAVACRLLSLKFEQFLRKGGCLAKLYERYEYVWSRTSRYIGTERSDHRPMACGNRSTQSNKRSCFQNCKPASDGCLPDEQLQPLGNGILQLHVGALRSSDIRS